MTEPIFPRRPDQRTSCDSRTSDAPKAGCDRSECASRSVLRPGPARVRSAGLVLASVLGALSVAAGTAHGQPSPTVSAQQESGALGSDGLDSIVTRIGIVEGETNGSVTLARKNRFRTQNFADGRSPWRRMNRTRTRRNPRGSGRSAPDRHPSGA